MGTVFLEEMMRIRKTEEKDTAAVLEVYEDAKQYFSRNGIPQWQKGTPNAETLQEDMQRGYSYVLEEDGEVIGTACIIEENDSDYLQISDGAWLNDEPYIVIHRIAVRSSCKGRGTASQLLSFAEKRLQERGWRNIRIDTHEKNRSMRRFLAKNGFVQCGSVIVGRWREPRIAYQKIM